MCSQQYKIQVYHFFYDSFFLKLRTLIQLLVSEPFVQFLCASFFQFFVLLFAPLLASLYVFLLHYRLFCRFFSSPFCIFNIFYRNLYRSSAVEFVQFILVRAKRSPAQFLASLFALFVVRFTVVFSSRNNVSILYYTSIASLYVFLLHYRLFCRFFSSPFCIFNLFYLNYIVVLQYSFFHIAPR